MKRIILAAATCLLMVTTSGAVAGDNNGDARNVSGWEAVGRLNIADRNMCTGALIAPDLVLTAAHCLFDPRNGRSVDPKKIEFEAGLHGNSVKASRMVSAAYIHQGYQHRHKGKAQIGYDIAIVKLKTPISPSQIVPFSTDARPDLGDKLRVISYTQQRANKPILQQPCVVLARQADTMVMNCEVEFGSSGAPVFAIQGGDRPRLVSVIAAKAEMGNRPVSIGTVVDTALRALLRRAG